MRLVLIDLTDFGGKVRDFRALYRDHLKLPLWLRSERGIELFDDHRRSLQLLGISGRDERASLGVHYDGHALNGFIVGIVTHQGRS